MDLQICRKTKDKLHKLLELRSQNDTELHVEQVRKKGISLINDFSLSSLGTFRNEILEELKSSKDDDLEVMVYRMQITCDEVIEVPVIKYIARSTIGYTLPPGL